MGQPTLWLKDGRESIPPQDTLSFASYRTALRDYLLAGNDLRWGKIALYFTTFGDGHTTEEYIQYLFLSTAGRKALPTELETLTALIDEVGLVTLYEKTRVIFDYISRLSEIYFFKSVKSKSVEQ